MNQRHCGLVGKTIFGYRTLEPSRWRQLWVTGFF